MVSSVQLRTSPMITKVLLRTAKVYLRKDILCIRRLKEQEEQEEQ